MLGPARWGGVKRPLSSFSQPEERTGGPGGTTFANPWSVRWLIPVGCLVLAACVGQPDLEDDFSFFDDSKSDAFSRDWQMVGPLPLGGAVRLSYRNPPRYRAFSYDAAEGDTLEVSVRAPDQPRETADPIAWILNR